MTYPLRGNEIEDHTMMKLIPSHINVYRAPSVDPYRIIFAFKSRLTKKGSVNQLSQRKKDTKPGLSDILKSLHFELSIPDEAIWWAPFAVVWGLYGIIRHKPSLIYSTTPPYSVALVGLVLHKLTGLPWVCEFRDPWTKNSMRRFGACRKKIEKYLERVCLKNASTVIATTPATADNYRRLCPLEKPQSSFATITNGFSFELFRDFPAPPDDGVFRIVFTGMFYSDLSPLNLFSAIELACRESEDFRANTEVIIAGQMPQHFCEPLTKEPLNNLVKILPYQDYDKTLELIAAGRALYLALSTKMEDIIPGKLFEYLAARRPILATVPLKGITVDYLNRFGAGIIVDPDDVAGIKNALLKMFNDFKQGELKVRHDLEDIKEFTWSSLADKLAALFDGNLSGRSN